MNKNKVLVMDSDFDAAESAAFIIRADGIRVSRAEDGEAALEMFLMDRPDAIVVSALPRNPDEFDICAAIAKDAHPVPVLVLTSPDEEDAFWAGRPRPVGASAFLPKPFLQEDLRATLYGLLAPPGKWEADEELDRVLDVLEPMKPGPAKTPDAPSSISPKISPFAIPVRFPVPAKSRPESVDSILADILADVGIEKKREKAVPPSGESITGMGPLVPQKPRPAAEQSSFFVIPEDIEKLPELEDFPSASENSLRSMPKKAKKKFGVKSLAIIGGLTIAVSVLIFGGLVKGKEPAVPDQTALEATRGHFEKELLGPLPEPAPIETSGVATPPPASIIKLTAPDQGAHRGLKAGEANPIPLKPAETAPPSGMAQIKVEPAVPSFGLQTGEISDIPIKPAETIPPLVTTPAKDVLPAVTAGQWVPLDQVDIQPQLTHSVGAVYPPSMMQLKIEGQLRFSVLISEKGDVLKAELLPDSTDNLGFEAAARTALLKRKYRPASKDGVPVQVSMPINVVFKLHR